MLTFTTDQIAKMSKEELAKALATAQAAAVARTTITCKVSEKGAMSVYGVGRFPVTLYKSQWERLLSESDKLKAFINANGDKLATKTA